MPLKILPACVVLMFAWSQPRFIHAQSGPYCQEHATLNTFERLQFVQVSLGTRALISAQYLSELGCARQMLDALDRLGAKINYSDEKSGFALVTIAREKLLDTLDVAGVEYAYTRDDDRNYYQDPDTKIPQSQREPEAVPEIAIPYPRVARSLRPGGPYYDTAVIGLDEFWKEHYEADGRGTRVAVPDEGFDLLHPALQQARDMAGNIVPKVADTGSLDGPEVDANWVEMGPLIDVSGGMFKTAGHTWKTPANGAYRFGIFKNTLTLGPAGNTPVKKLALSVGVLWNEKSGKVWVDTDGDGSFANQKALGDYGATEDIDWFGSKDGESDNRIPFAVKIDETRKAIYIRIGGDHGTLVAGPLAANTWTGGLFKGAAPGAQLVDEGPSRASLVADMVRMFARPDVDVINRSGGIGRAEYTGPREGIEDFAQRVLERCIEVYQKTFVAYSAAVGTIQVNDFASAEQLQRNRQLGPPYKDTMNSFVWNLQSGWVNTVLAPSTNLETESRYDPLDLPWPDGRKRSFDDKEFNPPAPDGYVIGANNSPTIPVVSGVVADLIGEARREHIRFSAERLNNAIFTGAKLLDGFPVSQQGYGLINAARSWDQLRKMATADDPANPELTRFSISRIVNGETISAQGFNESVNAPGTPVDSEIWITRHGGYSGARRYVLNLRGDAKSFELLDHKVTLVRDKAARVRFHAGGAPGWNIAFLELRDREANVVMEDVPLEVKAPEAGEMVAPGTLRIAADIPPLTSENRYVEVGNNVQAARYEIRAPYTGPDSIRSAPGIRTNDNEIPPGTPIDSLHHVGPVETFESLVANGEPGIQRIFWENRGRPEYRTPYDPPAPDVPIHAELTVTKYAVEIKRAGDALAVTNRLAGVEGRTVLYDASLQSETIAGAGPHGMGDLDKTVPANLAEWRLRVTPSVPSEGLADVYLLNCTGKNGCYVAATQEISRSAKTLTIEGPQTGAWKIAVRSRDQVQHTVVYEIHEALLTPAATPIETTDSQHATRTSWTLLLPKKQSDAQYAAFRIAGTPGVASEKNGLVIAKTPLDGNAP